MASRSSSAHGHGGAEPSLGGGGARAGRVRAGKGGRGRGGEGDGRLASRHAMYVSEKEEVGRGFKKGGILVAACDC